MESLKSITTNCSNFSTSDTRQLTNEHSVESEPFKVIKFVLYIIIFFISFTGNGFVCFTVWRQRRMRTVMNYLLVNLAVADLAITLVCIPFDLYVQERDYVWPYGAALCKLLYPLQTLSLYASVFTLAVISFSRHRAVVHPMKKQLTKRETKRLILAIWLLSFVLVIPYILVLRTEKHSEICREKWPQPESTYRTSYTLGIFITQYLAPLATIFWAYFLIQKDLRQKKIIRSEMSGSMAIHARENEKVYRMAVVLTVAFSFCMLPNHVIYILVDLKHDGKYLSLSNWLIASNLLLFLNCALDPILYAALNEKYRKEFRNIIHCREKHDTLNGDINMEVTCHARANRNGIKIAASMESPSGTFTKQDQEPMI